MEIGKNKYWMQLQHLEIRLDRMQRLISRKYYKFVTNLENKQWLNQELDLRIKILVNRHSGNMNQNKYF